MDHQQVYTAQIDAICAEPQFIIASALAREVKRVGIINTGNLLATLPTSIVSYFSMMIDHNIDDEDFNLDLMLATTVCLTAEGLDINDAEFGEQLRSFKMFMILQSLSRKGLAKVDANNQSLGKDAKHLMVAEITEKGRQLIQK